MNPRVLTTVLPAIAAASLAHAGTVASDVVIPQAPDDPGWTFRVEPYGWLTGLNGRTGVGPLVANVDQSFSDIFDDINMAAALQIEARRGRLGILADGFYADLGSSGETPGPFYDDAGLDIKQFIGELAVAWRVYESPKAFVDVYAGMRYNDLKTDVSGSPDLAGNQAIGQTVADRVVSTINERVDSEVESRADDFESAAAAERDLIEEDLRSAVLNDARDRVERDVRRQLDRFGRDHGFGKNHRLVRVVTAEVKAERLALARANAQLATAKLRASADATLQTEVAKAQAQVNKSEASLAKAIGNRITAALPTEASADVNWIDPIIGLRAQYDLTEKWYLAAKSDIGGFGVGSDFTWTAQATVGYQINESVSTEIGYRYMDSDFTDGAFVYDVAEHGVYLGLNVRF